MESIIIKIQINKRNGVVSLTLNQLVKLNDTERKALEKVLDMLELYNKDITYKNFLSNKMLIVHSIRRGIPYDLYEMIKDRTPFKQEDWAEFLGVSTRTLLRNKTKDNFQR